MRRQSGALVVKISVRLNMQRKVYSWDGARRCTICDSVIVRSARRPAAKKPSGAWLTHHAAAGRFSRLGPQAHLPLINVKISGPHGVGQYLRRALSACFLDLVGPLPLPCRLSSLFVRSLRQPN